MPKIEVQKAPEGKGSRYPAPFDEPCKARTWRKLGEAAGLTHIGVNLVRLPPGCWSSQRHWHEAEDEFVQVLEDVVLPVGVLPQGRDEVPSGGDILGDSADDPPVAAGGRRDTARFPRCFRGVRRARPLARWLLNGGAYGNRAVRREVKLR